MTILTHKKTILDQLSLMGEVGKPEKPFPTHSNVRQSQYVPSTHMYSIGKHGDQNFDF